jgi:poly-gamma-glutamate synthesis protein (capsule biosynthesis protein)
VISHHPHVVQGFEMFKGKPICYSLGNFCFPLENATFEWTQGAIAEIVIEKDCLSIKLHGCKINGNELSIINDDDWQSQLNDLLLEHYWQLFSCGGLLNPKKIKAKDICRYLLGKTSYVHLLNNIQCESHRWCIERGLMNVIKNAE